MSSTYFSPCHSFLFLFLLLSFFTFFPCFPCCILLFLAFLLFPFPSTAFFSPPLTAVLYFISLLFILYSSFSTMFCLPASFLLVSSFPLHHPPIPVFPHSAFKSPPYSSDAHFLLNLLSLLHLFHTSYVCSFLFAC